MPFVASGAMLIAASTNRFVAGPVPDGPLLPDVDRLIVALFVPSVNTTTVLAFRVNVDAVGLLTVTEHVYVPFACSAGPGVVHVSLDDCPAPGIGLSRGEIEIVFTLVPVVFAGVTVMTNVCEWLTSFNPFGAI